MALLTLIQQNNIKAIRLNWANNAKVTGGKTNFETLQEEIENLELKKLLGAALLLDIQTNPTEQKYIDLLDGKTFVDCNGNPIKFEGIRFQLSYMNHAEYLSQIGLEETYTGLVQKTRNEATTVPSGTLKNTAQRSKEIALNDFEMMKIFLNDNTTIYDLWNCSNTSKNLYNPKIFFTKKTAK